MSDEQLKFPFVNKKYGNYRRNIEKKLTVDRTIEKIKRKSVYAILRLVSLKNEMV